MEDEEHGAMKVVVVERTKHRIVFDVQNVAPKWCVALRSAIRYAVPTMRAHLCVVNPKTDTAMDYMWWTNRVSQIPLESSNVDEFSYVDECDKCEAGGPCCEAKLMLSITNHEDHPKSVYTDEIISSDPRVVPVNRSFSVVAFFNTPEGVGVETDLVHSFDDGDVVTVLDSACQPPLPDWLRAVKCGEKSLVLENLYPDQGTLQIAENINFESHTEMVGHISKRQLLYTLKEGETVSLTATVRKGTGRDGIKWSPIGGSCSYRPLFRDLKIDTEELNQKQLEELVNICPQKVFDIEDLTANVIVADADACNGCRACVRWAKENGLQQLHPGECPGPGKEKRSKKWRLPGKCWDCGQDLWDTIMFPPKRLFEWHRFTVETNGSMDAALAVKKALFIIQSRLVQKAESAGAQPKEYPKLI